MRKVFILIIVLGVSLSCEEVIQVELNESEPRLVIEATINLSVDQTSNAYVKLTKTFPYFDDGVPYVTDAEVIITDDMGGVFPFEYQDLGIYHGNLIPEFERLYTLEVRVDGDTYSGTQKLYSVPSLDFVEQTNDGGFGGDEVELKAFFLDPIGDINFYFFEALSEKGNLRDTFNDEFFDGNLFFGFYSDEDLIPGDAVVFNLYGVDESFYNFMFTLLQQTGSNNNGPFETQPATVRGNIKNVTNPDKYPLGYFRISEVSTLSYIVE